MKRQMTVRKGIEIAISHPVSGAALLAKTFHDVVKDQSWVDHDMQVRFCVLFMRNLIR